MALDQATLEGLSGAEQIVVLKSLKQQGAAWLLNVTARTLRDHPEVPRNSDGSYDAGVADIGIADDRAPGSPSR